MFSQVDEMSSAEGMSESDVSVASRTLVWENDTVVKVRIPREASQGSFPNGEENILYWQFCQNVRGGVVNIFVHTDVDVRDQLIIAKAKVMKKSLANGREYLYIDLVPVQDVPATHRFAAMSKMGNQLPKNAPDVFMFETPGSMHGLVIFAPLDSKIMAGGVVMCEIAAKTGDTQLQRLRNDGWKVDREDENHVYLSKTDGKGNKKTVTHHRPRR